MEGNKLPLVGGADVPPPASRVDEPATVGGAGPPAVRGRAGRLAERVDRHAADVGRIEPEDLAGGHHEPSWWQTGQMRRAPRRSQRCWLRAVASWNPHEGQDATQMPWSRCSAGGRVVVAGWLVAVG
jgi:hypothetical protein